jgi:hypothetical protein
MSQLAALAVAASLVLTGATDSVRAAFAEPHKGCCCAKNTPCGDAVTRPSCCQGQDDDRRAPTPQAPATLHESAAAAPVLLPAPAVLPLAPVRLDACAPESARGPPPAPSLAQLQVFLL